MVLKFKQTKDIQSCLPVRILHIMYTKSVFQLTAMYKWFCTYTVDPVTNDLASARQKKSLVTESRWSQE